MAVAQGLPAEWEVRDLAIALSEQMESLAPAIARFETAHWSGAAATYGEQKDLVAKEIGYAADAARALSEKPSGLGKAFELHMRVQAVEALLMSLASGARSYQQAAAADGALEIMDSIAPRRGKLRDYITDLAASTEQKLAAVDEEAQRCRAEMLKMPPVIQQSKKTKSK
jgi:hypothetical protein